METFLPLPTHPTTIEVGDQGTIRDPQTLVPLPTFRLKGLLRVRIDGKPVTVHNLVAQLHLPDKPPDATHAFFLTPDRSNCAASNLSWTKPDRRPIERKTGRPMPNQLVYALNARIKKGR